MREREEEKEKERVELRGRLFLAVQQLSQRLESKAGAVRQAGWTNESIWRQSSGDILIGILTEKNGSPRAALQCSLGRV